MPSYIKPSNTINQRIDSSLSPTHVDSAQNSDTSSDARQRILIFFDEHGIIFRTNIMTNGNQYITDEFVGHKLLNVFIVEYHNENILRPGNNAIYMVDKYIRRRRIILYG